MAWPGLAALALFPFFDSSSGLVKYPKTRPFFPFVFSFRKRRRRRENNNKLNSTAPLFFGCCCAQKNL
jgi:hypothetical protein